MSSGYKNKTEKIFIGILDPENQNKILKKIHLKNHHNLSTSGNYMKYYTINGEKYSHIINPLNQESVKNILSVSVISPHSSLSDIYRPLFYSRSKKN